VEESSFMSLPGTSWELVAADDRAELTRLAAAIDGLAADPKSWTPEDIALMMSGLSARILASVAGNERDLRDMIAALRTCLAVTWDMYDKIQADRTTVSQHIENLRDQIQGHEADLTALRLEGEAPPRE
jgi:hypothetical protein